MTEHDLNRVKKEETKNLHLLDPKKPWFTTWLTEKFTRLWIIHEHKAKIKIAIEDCTNCSWGCKNCERLKTN